MSREVTAGHPVPSPEALPAARQHRFAIVVGIDRYPGYRDLSGACNDAEAFADWVTDPRGGDVPIENVRTHLGRDIADVRSARPIKRDIDLDLHEIVQTVRSLAVPSRLYLYFAGHGIAAGLGTGALVMADAQPGLCWNLSLAPYRGWLERCRDFSEVVLVCDCCRIVATDVPEGMPPLDGCLQPSRRPQRTFVALAADLDERAYETSGARGQFTLILLEGLRGGAADPVSGEVRADVLAGFLESALSVRGNPPQRVETTVIGEPLSLARVEPARFDVGIWVREGPARAVGVVGPDGRELVSESRRPGPWTVRLGTGLYELVDPLAPSILFKVSGPGQMVKG